MPKLIYNQPINYTPISIWNSKTLDILFDLGDQDHWIVMDESYRLTQPKIPGFWEGKLHTQETKDILALRSTGRIQSADTLEKRRLSMLGKNVGRKRGPPSPESNSKRSSSMMGKYTGIIQTPEHVAKRVEASRGKVGVKKGYSQSSESAAKSAKSRTGLKQSPETIAKRKETQKRNKELRNKDTTI